MLKIGDRIQCISPFVNINGTAFYSNTIFTIMYLNPATDVIALIEPGRIGSIDINREELKQHFKSYPIIANTTNDNKSDDLDDALGFLPIGSAPQPSPWGGFTYTVPSGGGYTISSNFDLKFNPTPTSTSDIFTTKACECGSHKTYGKDYDGHSDFCPLYTGKK